MSTGARHGTTTYTIQSISGSTINVTESVTGIVAGEIAVLEGVTATGDRGCWPIASIGANSFVLVGTPTAQAAPGGTVKVYYRMSTYHFSTGTTENNITTDTMTELYTPSHKDNYFSKSVFAHVFAAVPTVRDWSEFDTRRNGYYSKFPGYTGYRILGCYYMGASSQHTHVISYKSGRNKNDNYMFYNQQIGRAHV